MAALVASGLSPAQISGLQMHANGELTLLDKSMPKRRSVCLSVLVEPAYAITCEHAGTPLGDPLEVGAAAAVLLGDKRSGADAASRPFCWASVKGYAGHQEAAAGGMLHLQFLTHRPAPNTGFPN